MILQQVKQAAQYKWVEILPAVAGLDEKQVSVKAGKAGTPCPICGGKDRYSFKKELHGEWACRGCQCGGDGFELVKRVNSCTFPEAIEKVAGYLGLSQTVSVNIETINRQKQKAAERAEQEKEERQRAAKAKLRTQTKWASIGDFFGNTYSEYKRFSPALQAFLRQQGQCISVPVYDAAGELISLQDIPETKDDKGRWLKIFQPRTTVKGGLLQWGQDSHYILLGEGVATVDAGFQLAGANRLAVCAFMASQLPAVAEIIRERYPDSEIFILTDKGEAGEKYAGQTVEKVSGCRAVLPPTGNDWSDYFLSGGKASPLEVEPMKFVIRPKEAHPETTEAIKSTVYTSNYKNDDKSLNDPDGEQWPEIKPLNTELLPVKPITPDMVPSALSGWLLDIVERMDNAPYEYAAISSLVAASCLIGRKVTIQPKQYDNWAVVPNLWGCCIGRPSAKKSPVMKAATLPLNQLHHQARERHAKEMEAYAAKEKITQMAMKEAERKAAEKVKKGDMQAAEALLMDKSGDPEKPVRTRYIVNDASVERLGVLLAENPKGLLLYRDELTGWLSGLNRDDKQQDRAFYLEAFNGDGSFSYDRISREDVYIPSNTVSLLGGIQPKKLLPLLMAQRDGSGDDGLVERLQIMVYPDDKPFKFTDRTPDIELKNAAYETFQKLDAIQYQEVEEDRPVLKFDSEAQALFNQWYSRLMERVRSGKLTLQMESYLGKYPSLLPSLAGIFHSIENGTTGRISADAVTMAIRWCDVLESHAMRVYALANDPLAGARVLVSRLDKLPPEFKAVDLRAKGWSGLTEQPERERALSILETHGYIVKVEARKSNKGRASITYRVNPAALAE